MHTELIPLSMDVTTLPIDGPLLLKPRIFEDERGFFFESYRESLWKEHGVVDDFVQDNHSRSTQNTLRGLHFQSGRGQAKLVRVSFGKIFDVVVDIRPDSQSFGRWHGVELSDESFSQFYVPRGFAHGFYVLSEVAEVQYKVSTPYDSKSEMTLAWNDPRVAVQWPGNAPLLSERDQSAQSFSELFS